MNKTECKGKLSMGFFNGGYIDGKIFDVLSDLMSSIQQ